MMPGYTADGLRKRTKVPEILRTDDDTEVRQTTSSTVSWREDNGEYWRFQNLLKTKIPGIIFYNETFDPETHTVTSQISDFTCQINTLAALENVSVSFTFTESILILEYKIGEAQQQQYYKARRFLFILWIIFIATSSLFVWKYYERYSRMLSFFL